MAIAKASNLAPSQILIHHLYDPNLLLASKDKTDTDPFQNLFTLTETQLEKGTFTEEDMIKALKEEANRQQVPEHTIKKLSESVGTVFSKIDTDSDKKVSKAEFDSYINKIKGDNEKLPLPKLVDILAFVKREFAKNTRLIVWSEVDKAMERWAEENGVEAPAEVKDLVKTIFDWVDRNNDKALTKNELEAKFVKDELNPLLLVLLLLIFAGFVWSILSGKLFGFEKQEEEPV